MSRGVASLAKRARIAVTLAVGFYVLALGTSAVLIYVTYWMLAHPTIVFIKLVGIPAMGALLILGSLMPRRDRFEPPGPAITAEVTPALFELIRDVARDTGQAMPSEIYVAPDLNASVTVRGGFMGVGGRFVMTLGLPLLHVFTVGELRSVLAHEFGHSYGGDLRLGPWIYTTRAAIARTIDSLSVVSATVQAPFVWYANAFLRITQSIVRGQELSADGLAARLYGPSQLSAALQKSERLHLAFAAYWSTEVVPVLSAARVPLIGAGFDQFLVSDAVREAIEASAGRPERRHPHDSHPVLSERIAAVASYPELPGPRDQRPALVLAGDAVVLDRALQSSLGRRVGEPVEWDEVGEAVLVPAWTSIVGDHRQALAGVRVISLVDVAPALVSRIADTMTAHVPSGFPRQHLLRSSAGVLEAALGLVLHGRGGRVHNRLGRAVSVESPVGVLEPSSIVRDLLMAKIDPPSWTQLTTAFSLEDAVLAPGTFEDFTPRERRDAREVATSLTADQRAAPRPLEVAITIRCWSCREALPVTEATRGRMIKCPACGTSQKLPG